MSAYLGAISGDLVRPTGLDQHRRLGAARPAGNQGGAVLLVGAQQEDLPSMRVRRPRLGVQIVAVVPDRDQAQLGHGCKRGGPSPDDDPGTAPAHREKPPVALIGLQIGGQHHMRVAGRSEEFGQGGVEPVDIAGVR